MFFSVFGFKVAKIGFIEGVLVWLNKKRLMKYEAFGKYG
jgi:hypothetical protein